ncbi:NAD(P)(+) transhydrogenase (Re/Si-specific) subunit alpha, partial [Streptomyces roseofulvus]
MAADVVLGVNAPSAAQLDGVRAEATVIAMFSPAFDPAVVEDLGRRPFTAVSMDAVPRISRAQSMDVLSS